MHGPLQGIRVIEWAIFQQGPVAGSMLGDMGAEVIKVEDRIRGDPGRGLTRTISRNIEIPAGRNFYFETNNRNKKGITVDLKKEKGKEIIYLRPGGVANGIRASLVLPASIKSLSHE